MAFTFNKDIGIPHEEAKKRIEEAGYTYFEFNKPKIKAVALAKDITDIPTAWILSIIQAIFPEYLICSGIFDSVVLFRVANGKRIDPPVHYWRNLNAYIDNGKNGKQEHALLAEIKDLFEKSGIEPSDSWLNYFNKFEQNQKTEEQK